MRKLYKGRLVFSCIGVRRTKPKKEIVQSRLLAHRPNIKLSNSFQRETAAYYSTSAVAGGAKELVIMTLLCFGKRPYLASTV